MAQTAMAQRLPQPDWGSPAPQRYATQEQVQVIAEKAFASEKQLQRELLIQQTRLQHQEDRLHEVESKLNPQGSLAIHSGASTSNAASLYTGDLSDKAVWTRMQYLEDQVKRLTHRLQELSDSARKQQDGQNSSLPPVLEHLSALQVEKLQKLPELIDRVDAVEMSNMSLEAQQLEQKERIETLDSKQNLSSTNGDDQSNAGFMLEAPVFELQDSLWNVMIFIGTDELGSGASIWASALALSYTLLLFSLLCVIYIYFVGQLEVDEGAVQAATQFRLGYAHDHKFLDQISQTSLAQRLCDSELHGHGLQMEIASTQIILLAEIEEFLKADQSHSWFEHAFSGQTMVCVALVVWLVSMMRELMSLMNFANAIWNMPRSRDQKSTRIVLDVSSNQLYFETLANSRFAYIIILAVMQAAIAGSILYFGSAWLSSTANVRDLLLNSVALEFIINLDERMFEGFTSSHTRALVHHFKPLKRSYWWHLRGMEARKVIMSFAAGGFIAWMYWTHTKIMVDHMEAVWHAFCDPPLDFTFGVDALNFVHIAPTGGLETTKFAKFIEVRQKAVQEVLEKHRSLDLTWSFDRSDISRLSVGDVITRSTHDIVNFHSPSCKDTDPDQNNLYTLMGEYVFGVESCQGMVNECWDKVIVRTLCPETCGCNQPDSILPISSAAFGCPSACMEDITWKAALEKARCTNHAIHELNQTWYWPVWVEWTRVMEKDYKELGPAMAKYGCDFSKGLSRTGAQIQAITSRLCQGSTSSGLKPIAMVCPETCRCGSNDADSYCTHGASSGWCYYCQEDFKHMLVNSKSDVSSLCAQWLCNDGRYTDAWEQAEPYFGSQYANILSHESVAEICKGW